MSEQVQVVDIKSMIERTYTIALDGCEPRDWPNSRSGRTWRPARLVVVKRDGNVSLVELSGPQVKKDGADGCQWAREWFYSWNERPAWITSIIAGLA